MRKFFTLTILMVSCISVYAAKYVRYNVAGYDSNRPKKILVIADENCSGIAWTAKNAANTTVLSGTIGASLAAAGNYTPKAFNHSIDLSAITTAGTYQVTITGITPFSIKVQDRPHAALIASVLKTIRARRSGSNDAYVHPMSHLGDTSCAIYERTGTNNNKWAVRTDGKKAKMVGGYYDAGDYIKFTATNAYLTYNMLRAYEAAPELFDGVKTMSKTTLDDMLDECKWGLEFLSQTNPEAGIFIIQTGGSKDHDQGDRLPQNDALNGKRECYSNLSRPQMGTTVAALALGAKVFAAKGLTAEATKYKNMALQIYTAAKAATGTAAWWQGGGEVYYADKTLEDNMGLAAIEMYLLTNTATYLTDAKSYAATAGSGAWVSYGDLTTHLNNRLMPSYPAAETILKEDMDVFQANATTAGNIWGLPHESVWGSLYGQLGVASNAILYKLNKNNAATAYDNMPYNVVDYLFGTNNWGWAFIASKLLPAGTGISTSYARMYQLQPTIFPEGEIAEGPDAAADYTSESPNFAPAHNPNLWFKDFNTSLFTFFEEPGDYISMETTIGGLGDGVLLLTLSSKYFSPAAVAVKPTITFADVNKVYGDAVFNMTATSNSTGAITYTVLSGTAAAITPAGAVTITGAGAVKVLATQAAATGYLTDTSSAILTIAKASPVLVITSANSGVVGAQISLTSTSGSTGTITYSVNPTGTTATYTLTGTVLKFNSSGVINLKADQAATANYNAAAATQAINVSVATSTEDLTTSGSVKVYPIPVQDLLNIEFISGTIAQAALYDSKGQLLLSNTSGDHRLQFATDSLGAGVYILKVFTSQGVEIFKVLK